ncbi:hypothetical protein JCM5353_006539 [Sporobolomyces roseus]
MRFSHVLLFLGTLFGVTSMAFAAHSHTHEHHHFKKEVKGKMDKRNILNDFEFDSHGRHFISDVFSPLKDVDGLSRTSHWIDKDGFDSYSTSTSFGKGIDHEKVLKDGFNEGGDGNKDDGLFKIQKRKKRGLAGKGEGEIGFVVGDGFLDEELEDPFDIWGTRSRK